MKRKIINVLREQDDEKNLLVALRDFARDKIRTWDLEDADPMISNVHPKMPRGNSIVTFNMKDKEVYDLLDLGEENEYALDDIKRDYDLVDSYSLKQDFEDGYGFFWDILNEENKNTLKRIASYLLPGVEFNLGNTEYQRKLNKILIDNFEYEVERVLSEFHYYEDQAVRETMKNTIKEDIDEMLYGTGFFMDSDFKLYSTVAHLIVRIRETNYSGDLSGLIKSSLKDKGSRLYWAELRYNSDDKYFDYDGYNKSAYSELNSIEEEILEDPTITENVEMAERITKIIPMNTPVPIPKEKTASVEILGFEDGKVKVNIVSPKFGAKLKKLSEENFYNLLYQLELFDLDA